AILIAWVVPQRGMGNSGKRRRPSVYSLSSSAIPPGQRRRRRSCRGVDELPWEGEFMPDVLCIGNIQFDVLARPVVALPRPGALARVDEIRFSLGGNGMNVAAGLARLGIPTALFGRARGWGVTTVPDVCWDGEGLGLSFLAPCLPHTDLFAPSLEEGRQLTGQDEPAAIAATLLDAGAGAVGVKMGVRGCYLAR